MVFMGDSIRSFRQSQRTKKERSTEEFSATIGISQSMLSKYENNKSHVPVDVAINITKRYKNVKILSIWVAKLFEIVHKELITV